MWSKRITETGMLKHERFKPHAFRNRIATLFPVLMSLLLASMTVFASGNTNDDGSIQVEITALWSGNYPTASLDLLPQATYNLSVGYLNNETAFDEVWHAFKPDQPVPHIDFDKNIVIYTRNTQFYNSTRIMKVTLKDGVMEVLAIETMSALPIEDKVAMSMAVVSKQGVSLLKSGEHLIPVNTSEAE